MLLKIFLTLSMIIGLAMYVRRRGSGAQSPPARSRTANAPKASEKEPFIPRPVLYIFILLMLSSTAFILYFDWEKNYRVVTVRVINSQTGNLNEYQARRGDIEGRMFETIEGKQVTLADVERMEIDISTSD
ncbi:MAG: hypothetical protein HUJ30_04255 [Gammaproteobacteria bacterium]|nr:hypothetical protein [Gammaproteobacteria bacterium]